MEGENIPKGIHKICYENHLVYTLFSLESQIGLQTDYSKSIAKDLSFIIHIEGKLLPLSKVSHLMKNNKITDARLLINIPILAIVKAHSEYISKLLFGITSLIDCTTEVIKEDCNG